MKLPGRLPDRRPTVSRAGRRAGGRTPVRPERGGQAYQGGTTPLHLPRPARVPRFGPARAGAVLGILTSLGAIYGLTTSSAFTYTRAEVPELRWTSGAAIETALGIPTGTNLFRLTVAPLEDRIRALPGVADATVTVALPDALVVGVTERVAIIAWSVGATQFLVDRDGVLFAAAEPGAAVAAGLPIIVDSRVASAGLTVGDALDPVDLDAATRLGSLVPADVGSVADRLLVTVSDATGFVLGSSPASWVATFGLYTPTKRPPYLIPGQVRLLRSLLNGREAGVAKVILADAENGTFVPKATPRAAAP